MTLADLKAVISSDTNIQTNVQAFRFNGQQLSDDSNTLENVGIKEGDMVSMLVRHPQAGSRTRPSQPMGTSRGGRGRGTPTRGQGAQQPRDDAEIIRLQALGDPQVLEQLRHHRSDLANAVQDPQQFRQIYDSLRRQQDEAEREKREAVEALNADPLNVEAQAKIEEMIREAAVMENLQNAMHYTPEGKPDLRSLPFYCLRAHALIDRLQRSAGYICCTLTSRSTETKSKPSSIRAPRPPSCLHLVQRNAES